MPLRAAGNVGLGHLAHRYRGLHPRLYADFLQEVLQGKAVHHRTEHAHVVRAVTFHPVLLKLGAAEEITASDHDRHLDTHLHHDGNLFGKPGNNVRINADLATTEDLTRELQHHALVRTIHSSGPLSVGSCSRNADARSLAPIGANCYAPAASKRTNRSTLIPASSSCLPKAILLSVTDG